MTKEEVRALPPGLYELHWRTGGTSLAAVGVTAAGGRWMAPVNWVVPSVRQRDWRAVVRAVAIGRTSTRVPVGARTLTQTDDHRLEEICWEVIMDDLGQPIGAMLLEVAKRVRDELAARRRSAIRKRPVAQERSDG